MLVSSLVRALLQSIEVGVTPARRREASPCSAASQRPLFIASVMSAAASFAALFTGGLPCFPAPAGALAAAAAAFLLVRFFVFDIARLPRLYSILLLILMYFFVALLHIFPAAFRLPFIILLSAVLYSVAV